MLSTTQEACHNNHQTIFTGPRANPPLSREKNTPIIGLLFKMSGQHSNEYATVFLTNLN